MDKEFEDKMVKTLKKRRKADLKNVIDFALKCPTKDAGDVVEIDGSLPIKDYLDKNIDMLSYIVLRLTSAAAGGDTKATELLFKYGGMQPPTEVEHTILPTFIEDIPVGPAVNVRSLPENASGELEADHIVVDAEIVHDDTVKDYMKTEGPVPKEAE